MAAWLSILLRSLAVFVIVFFFIRILGKKHPVKLTPFRFVNYIVIAVITALAAAGVIRNLVFAMVALSVWMVFPYVIEHLEMRSKMLHDIVEGKETVLIKQGKIMEENLKTVRLTAEELLKDLRSRNVFSVADVEFAILETNGEVNVMLKADRTPVTSHDLEWKVTPQTEPQTVILDGSILNNPLTELGLTRNWLQTQLVSTGVSLDNVFLGQINSAGELYLDLFNDAVRLQKPSVRESLYAVLEKCQADLYKYALDTQDSKVRWMYEKNAARLQQVLELLRPLLLR